MSVPGPFCRRCGAPITWVTTAAHGKKMPLDREPVPSGNIAITPVSGVAMVLRADDDAPPGTDRYVAHFATCNAERARRYQA